MRDENDWRIGDKITEGPDWRNSFRKPWDEHWTFGTAGKWEPIVRKVYRCHGNVIRVNIGHARGSFAITVNGKRYILNPACRNGGYRSNNNPDPKYQTDANGRFVNPKRRRSSHGGQRPAGLTMAPLHKLQLETMSDTINDKQSTEDGGAVDKPVVVRSTYCHTCARSFHMYGINRHRAMHRDKREDCEITYTHGDRYVFHYSQS